MLVSPHWGPNMTVRTGGAHPGRAARALLAAGATLVAGHSAHVVHGAARAVLYDLGDLVDDYAVDAQLRNDLGLLFLVDLDAGRPAARRGGPARARLLPHAAGGGRGGGMDPAALRRRVRGAGTAAVERDGRVVVSW